ncbi:MAG: hypothetical protein J3K34DRAFT_526666 [Monoraphidium minutum]|nr:MAG: hypothetical protein J3K34DRAFT_526666 [Monoraphidium minutum]
MAAAVKAMWQSRQRRQPLLWRGQQQQQQQQDDEEEEEEEWWPEAPRRRGRPPSRHEREQRRQQQQQQQASGAQPLAQRIRECRELWELLPLLETHAEELCDCSSSSSSSKSGDAGGGDGVGGWSGEAGAAKDAEDAGAAPTALGTAFAAAAALADRRGRRLLADERAALRALVQGTLLPALRGREAAALGGPRGAAAALAAAAAAGLAAAELPRAQLGALMAAAGDPFQLQPATVGALLPALAALGFNPGRLWLSAAAAALHFRHAGARRYDVVRALSALAALRHAPPAAAVADLLRALTSTREHVSRLSGPELAELAAALRALRYRPPPTFVRLLLDASVAKLPHMTAAEMASLLRSLAWAGARPGPAWGAALARRSWAVLPGAAPGALAELLHFAVVLRLGPPPRWAHDCLSLMRAAQRDALRQRRELRAAAARGVRQRHGGGGGEGAEGQAAAGAGPALAAGCAPLLTPHEVALAAHALALLPRGGRAAAAHQRWLGAAVAALAPAALGLPLAELSYLLFAVARLRLAVPREWLVGALEQLDARVAAAQQAGAAQTAATQQAAAQQAAAGADAARAAELAAAFSLLVHFAGSADGAWRRRALAAVARAGPRLPDDALLHALIGCAALGLGAAPPHAAQGAAAGATSPEADVGALLALAAARLRAHAARRDAVALSRASRALQAHWRGGLPSWYQALLREAGSLMAGCAPEAGSQPARRLAGGGAAPRGK